MCNCIQETEKKTTELLIKKNPDKQVLNVELVEIGFSFKGSQTYNTIKYTLNNKKKSINIYHTYCPFCGEKYPELK